MRNELIARIETAMAASLSTEQLAALHRVLVNETAGLEIEATIRGEETEQKDFLTAFLSAKRVEGCSDKTIHYYKITLEKMIATLGKPVQATTTDDMRHYLDDYQHSGRVGKSTIDNMRRIFSSFFAWLEDEDYIVKSPMRRIHKVKTVKTVKTTYGHNTKMVQETDNYWGNIPDDIGTTNASGSTGDGIVMATAVGAATTGMEYTQLMAIADPESGDLFTGLVPMSTANYVFVNQEGNRFVNESAPRDVLAAAAIENGGLFYMIADINIAEDSRWLSNWEEQVERQNTIMADTLEELADKLGFDETAKANFLKAMENYNSYVDAGEDPECGKTSFALKVEQGPFFASPRKPAIHHTMGGLKINATTEVLNENGEAIPGLYAAGEVCGGIHAGNRIGGNAVADALVFGRIAGETASTQN